MRVLGLLLTVAFASAAAAPMERVQVGVKGRNATRVDVPVGDYTSAKFDGEQGDWQGPAYTATQSATTGRAGLSFRSDFEDDVGSLDGMVKPTTTRSPRPAA